MGSTVCEAVVGDPELELVAAVDPFGAGRTTHGLELAASLDAFNAAGAEVVVDFTVAAAARTTLPWLADHGIHAVVGTTGFTSADHETFRAAFRSSNCLIVANFAISAVLMMRFAELAAPFFDTAEIIELHHDGKIDAPSGTAVVTAERMAAASATGRATRPPTRWSRGPAEGGPRRYPPAFGADAGHGRPPRGHPRRRRPDPHDPSGQLRPVQLHAGGAARLQACHRPPRSDPGPRVGVGPLGPPSAQVLEPSARGPDGGTVTEGGELGIERAGVRGQRRVTSNRIVVGLCVIIALGGLAMAMLVVKLRDELTGATDVARLRGDLSALVTVEGRLESGDRDALDDAEGWLVDLRRDLARASDHFPEMAQGTSFLRAVADAYDARVRSLASRHRAEPGHRV